MYDGGDWMGKPSKFKIPGLILCGFLLSIVEPIVLLISGRDIASALWPMANRSLDITFFLRDWHIELFAFTLFIIPFGFFRSLSATKLEKNLSWIIMGFTFGLILIYLLLNYAYLKDAFVLLPTCLGIILLYSCLIAFEVANYSISGIKLRLSHLGHLASVLVAIWLISPGVSSMAGLLPTPPELDLQEGRYVISTQSYEYPMPEEVAKIQGDYEEGVIFSVYITTPLDVEHKIPLAIILHGFANPFFESYKDWVEELSSRGMAVAFIQYPSDVMPPGYDSYTLVEKDGMSNHPFHVPRVVAIEAAIEHLNATLPDNVDRDHILVGGHSLGAGYAMIVLDRILDLDWGQESVFVSLEAPYARPSQEDLEIDLSNLPDKFLAHVAISEDDMSVNDCFGVHHHEKLGHGSLLIEVPSDRYGFPRLVATHYLQASETHDTLADWGFYRRVANQAEWLVAGALGNVEMESNAKSNLIDSDDFRYMGKWSDGTDVLQLRTYADPLNSSQYGHCSNWVGP